MLVQIKTFKHTRQLNVSVDKTFKQKTIKCSKQIMSIPLLHKAFNYEVIQTLYL